jgi:hypothetical protein
MDLTRLTFMDSSGLNLPESLQPYANPPSACP